MDILILADVNSVHTQRWVLSLSQFHKIGVFTLNKPKSNWYVNHNNIVVFDKIAWEVNHIRFDSLTKVKYLFALPYLWWIIKKHKPGYVHAYYASSYGLLGALVRSNNYYVSVWGSDVLQFPKRSRWHKMILQYVLRQSKMTFCTSEYLEQEVSRLTHCKTMVIPFGIEINKFEPSVQNQSLFKEEDIVIGTVKALEKPYGIDKLLHTFKILSDRNKQVSLKLLIVGSGSLMAEMRELAAQLGIQDKVVFTGYVSPNEVAKFHKMITIFVALSNFESFGVSVLEACALEKPVIVANTGGLKEIVKDCKTGFVVNTDNLVSVSNLISKLMFNKPLMKEIGEAARRHVMLNYLWSDSVLEINRFYV